MSKILNELEMDETLTLTARFSKWRRIAGLKSPVPWIAFLGADGSGKSTVIESVDNMLKGHGIALDLVHWRPALVVRGSNNGPVGPVTDPHSKPPRDWLSSVLKLLMLWVDWWSATLRQPCFEPLRPRMLISDRYYRDIEVDPKRYRYGAPKWLASCVNGLMPKPDLVFILTGDPEAIYERKKEVTLNELERQMNSYHSMARRLGGVAIEIDTTQPLIDTLSEVNSAVVAKFSIDKLEAMS